MFISVQGFRAFNSISSQVITFAASYSLCHDTMENTVALMIFSIPRTHLLCFWWHDSDWFKRFSNYSFPLQRTSSSLLVGHHYCLA